MANVYTISASLAISFASLAILVFIIHFFIRYCLDLNKWNKSNGYKVFYNATLITLLVALLLPPLGFLVAKLFLDNGRDACCDNNDYNFRNITRPILLSSKTKLTNGLDFRRFQSGIETKMHTPADQAIEHVRNKPIFDEFKQQTASLKSKIDERVRTTSTFERIIGNLVDLAISNAVCSQKLSENADLFKKKDTLNAIKPFLDTINQKITNTAPVFDALDINMKAGKIEYLEKVKVARDKIETNMAALEGLFNESLTLLETTKSNDISTGHSWVDSTIMLFCASFIYFLVFSAVYIGVVYWTKSFYKEENREVAVEKGTASGTTTGGTPVGTPGGTSVASPGGTSGGTAVKTPRSTAGADTLGDTSDEDTSKESFFGEDTSEETFRSAAGEDILGDTSEEDILGDSSDEDTSEETFRSIAGADTLGHSYGGSSGEDILGNTFDEETSRGDTSDEDTSDGTSRSTAGEDTHTGTPQGTRTPQSTTAQPSVDEPPTIPSWMISIFRCLKLLVLVISCALFSYIELSGKLQSFQTCPKSAKTSFLSNYTIVFINANSENITKTIDAPCHSSSNDYFSGLEAENFISPQSVVQTMHIDEYRGTLNNILVSSGLEPIEIPEEMSNQMTKVVKLVKVLGELWASNCVDDANEEDFISHKNQYEALVNSWQKYTDIGNQYNETVTHLEPLVKPFFDESFQKIHTQIGSSIEKPRANIQAANFQCEKIVVDMDECSASEIDTISYSFCGLLGIFFLSVIIQYLPSPWIKEKRPDPEKVKEREAARQAKKMERDEENAKRKAAEEIERENRAREKYINGLPEDKRSLMWHKEREPNIRVPYLENGEIDYVELKRGKYKSMFHREYVPNSEDDDDTQKKKLEKNDEEEIMRMEKEYRKDILKLQKLLENVWKGDSLDELGNVFHKNFKFIDCDSKIYGSEEFLEKYIRYLEMPKIKDTSEQSLITKPYKYYNQMEPLRLTYRYIDVELRRGGPKIGFELVYDSYITGYLVRQAIFYNCNHAGSTFRNYKPIFYAQKFIDKVWKNGSLARFVKCAGFVPNSQRPEVYDAIEVESGTIWQFGVKWDSRKMVVQMEKIENELVLTRGRELDCVV